MDSKSVCVNTKTTYFNIYFIMNANICRQSFDYAIQSPLKSTGVYVYNMNVCIITDILCAFIWVSF